jgi:chaperonin cofactor prefoldin
MKIRKKQPMDHDSTVRDLEERINILEKRLASIEKETKEGLSAAFSMISDLLQSLITYKTH